MTDRELMQPEPPCKTGSQCVGGKCDRCTGPEPVAWNELANHYCYLLDNLGDLPIPYFEKWASEQWKKGLALLEANDYFRAAPPRKEWQFLTDEEYRIIHNKNYNYEELARAIEAKLKEKNA